MLAYKEGAGKARQANTKILGISVVFVMQFHFII